MLARTLFSHQELEGKSQPEMHQMLYTVGVNWAERDTWEKHGIGVYRIEDMGWYVDKSIPVFTQDRKWLQKKIPRYPRAIDV